jgi:hypothetical protein
MLHAPKAPAPNVPDVIFDASTLEMLAFVTQLVGRDTVPVAVKLLVPSALVTVTLLSNWAEPLETWNFAEGAAVPTPTFPPVCVRTVDVAYG